MTRPRTRFPGLLAPLIFLLFAGCGAGEPEPPAPELDASLVGELVEVVLADGRTTLGVAVLIAQSDGTTQPAIFRGPRPLADAASEGTWTFREEALHARVRPLAPDERLRVREG